MMDGLDGMGFGGWFFMTAFWVAVIATLVWVVASLTPRRHSSDGTVTERPDEILDRRLARGEIDTATYDALRSKLSDAQTGKV